MPRGRAGAAGLRGAEPAADLADGRGGRGAADPASAGRGRRADGATVAGAGRVAGAAGAARAELAAAELAAALVGAHGNAPASAKEGLAHRIVCQVCLLPEAKVVNAAEAVSDSERTAVE